MNNSICTLFDNILIDIHKFKSLQHYFVRLSFHLPSQENRTLCKFNSVKIKNKVHTTVCNNMVTIFLMIMQIYPIFSEYQKEKG